MQLQNRVAIITGATGRIGKPLAEAYAREGARVVIASRNTKDLDNLAQSIRQVGGEVLAVPTDVTSESQVAELFRRSLEEWQRLDVVVNSAGLLPPAVPIEDFKFEEWQCILDVNVTGTYLCCREAFRVMKRQKSGRIINVGSLSAIVSRPDSAAYTASKFAVEGLTRSLALDGRAYGIAVSIIQPGFTVPQHANGDAGRAHSQSGEEVARLAVLMAALPATVNLFEAVILPVRQPSFLGRG